MGAVVFRMVPTFRVMQDRIDGINQVLREQITGIRVVRAFVREGEETQRFEGANAELTTTSLRAGRLMALFFPIVVLVINGSSVAVIWFGGNRIADGSLSIGALIAFLSYFVLILMSVMMATFVASMAPRAAVCADRIQEVLYTDSSVWAPASPAEGLETLGSVEFTHVTFRYPGAEAPVLSDVSFATPAGTTTAIIGSTGAGKTTLVNLAARLVDVDGGGVLLGGADIRTLDPAQLWNRIGLIPQKPYLFSGTVRSNLLYGKPDATDEELWAALQVAQAADFVAAMPGGLDTPIEQGGTNVSGGQRQRLAIARALVRQPDVYLFDDSFSALDVATDARLRDALAPHTREAAVIVVAQRVSTIRHADQIVVLEDGTVLGVGTHERTDGHVPDLPGDRRIAAPGGGGLMETRTAADLRPRRRRRSPRSPSSAWDRASAASAPSACRPRRRPTSSRSSSAWRPCCGASASACVAVFGLAVRQHGAVRGRAEVAGPGHRRDLRRSPLRRAVGHRLRLAAPGAVVRARPLRGRRRLQLPAGLRADRDRAADHVPPPGRSRGQAQPTAAQVRRRPGPWRPAQPGHQRHRQPGPGHAADA